MSSSTLQATWYGGNGLDQPPLVQFWLTDPKDERCELKSQLCNAETDFSNNQGYIFMCDILMQTEMSEKVLVDCHKISYFSADPPDSSSRLHLQNWHSQL